MAWQSCMKSSSVIMPGLLGAAIAYGALRISPFQAQAKYAAIVGGLFGLIAGRITISQMCLSKIVSANSSLRDRLIEAGYYGNRSMRYSIIIEYYIIILLSNIISIFITFVKTDFFCLSL